MLTLFLVDRWKEILNDVVLPVVDLSIALHLCFCILNVIDIEPRVVLEVSECDFVEFLGKEQVSARCGDRRSMHDLTR